MKAIGITALLFVCASAALAQDAETDANAATEDAAAEESAGAPNGDGIESPKTMSGMSILGNEEAPKALVIVPWKSSELGETISLNDTLDERAQPVDKDEFQRQLRFYEIRSGE
jgi:Tfp pilus assembly protein PilX